jgi:transcriptional regulator with XRE-family HTH domain
MKRTQEQLAELLGVSRQTISTWKRQGADLSDLDALRARAAAVVAKETATEGYAEARTRKTRAEADRAETLAARERGELVLASGIMAEGEAAGRAFQNGLNRLEGDLPGRLAGRTAGEIQKILRTSFRELLNELADCPSDKYFKL